MAEFHDPQSITLGKERTSMLESLLLLAFCLFVGLLAVAVCGYLAVSHLLFTMDGLLLTLISLTIGGIFVLNVGWSVYTGELKQMLEQRHKKPASSEPSGKPTGDAPS
jgi:hypothetical protein